MPLIIWGRPDFLEGFLGVTRLGRAGAELAWVWRVGEDQVDIAHVGQHLLECTQPEVEVGRECARVCAGTSSRSAAMSFRGSAVYGSPRSPPMTSHAS
jgi:hypothetical protein